MNFDKAKVLVVVNAQNDFMSVNGSISSNFEMLKFRFSKKDYVSVIFTQFSGNRFKNSQALSHSYGWNICCDVMSSYYKNKKKSEADPFFIEGSSLVFNSLPELVSKIDYKYNEDFIYSTLPFLSIFYGVQKLSVELMGCQLDSSILANAVFLKTKLPKNEVMINTSCSLASSSHAFSSAVDIAKSIGIKLVS